MEMNQCKCSSSLLKLLFTGRYWSKHLAGHHDPPTSVVSPLEARRVSRSGPRTALLWESRCLEHHKTCKTRRVLKAAVSKVNKSAVACYR